MSTLLVSIRESFARINDPRAKNVSHRLSDILMSALAMFQLKYPSLNAFEKQTTAEKHNLRTVYGVSQICSDAQLRNVLDVLSTEELQPLFKQFYRYVDTSGLLKHYCCYRNYIALALDGVEYFHSEAVNCSCCQEKKHRDGRVSYSHSAVCAVMLCPGRSTVFPIGMESVSRQDGSIKNDCERNATGRLLPRLKECYGSPPFVLTGDALYANAPCVRAILQNNWHFILNVKPGSHESLFRSFEQRQKNKVTRRIVFTDSEGKHAIEWTNNLPLCDSAGDVRANMIYYQVTDKKGKKTTFTWVTDMSITKANVKTFVKIGRSRWKIENETFNTLKNQGYNLEHNYGHGYQNLAFNMALLMVVAFLLDQIVEATNTDFLQILSACGTKIKVWNCQRSLFSTQYFLDFKELFQKLAALFDVFFE